MDSVRYTAGPKNGQYTVGLLARSHIHRSSWCPRQDSNLRSRLRRAVLYPLSYGGMPIVERRRAYRTDRPRLAGSGAQVGGGSGCAPRWVIRSAMYLLSAPCEMTILSARFRT